MSRSSTKDSLDALDLGILETLADGLWHAGPELAEAADISRAALGKRITQISEGHWGLDIESRHGRGYRIAGGLDLLSQAAGRPKPSLASVPGLLLRTHCHSTNDELLAAPEAEVAITEFQSGGRGRRGRRWVAPFAQNLLISIRYRYTSWPSDLPALSLCLGLAIVRLLRQRKIPAQIKWPNDIWLKGRKLGGILVDSRGEINGQCEVIIGMGLNVHMLPNAQAAEIDQAWTSLSEEGFQEARADLAAACISALRDTAAAFAQGLPASLISDFAQWDVFAGAEVELSDGEQTLKGVSAGVSAQGAFLLKASDGKVHTCVAGDLSLRKKI